MEVLAMKVKNSIKEVLKPLIQGTLAEHLMKVGALYICVETAVGGQSAEVFGFRRVRRTSNDFITKLTSAKFATPPKSPFR